MLLAFCLDIFIYYFLYFNVLSFMPNFFSFVFFPSTISIIINIANNIQHIYTKFISPVDTPIIISVSALLFSWLFSSNPISLVTPFISVSTFLVPKFSSPFFHLNTTYRSTLAFSFISRFANCVVTTFPFSSFQ